MKKLFALLLALTLVLVWEEPLPWPREAAMDRGWAAAARPRTLWMPTATESVTAGRRAMAKTLWMPMAMGSATTGRAAGEAAAWAAGPAWARKCKALSFF